MDRVTTLTLTWHAVASDLLHLGLAYLLALPIGWNRDREDPLGRLSYFPDRGRCGLRFHNAGHCDAGRDIRQLLQNPAGPRHQHRLHWRWRDLTGLWCGHGYLLLAANRSSLRRGTGPRSNSLGPLHAFRSLATRRQCTPSFTA